MFNVCICHDIVIVLVTIINIPTLAGSAAHRPVRLLLRVLLLFLPVPGVLRGGVESQASRRLAARTAAARGRNDAHGAAAFCLCDGGPGLSSR